jgi:hypothetical protein
MTTGYSGTFAVNGTDFIIQPFQFGWDDKELIGVDGNGRPLYPAVNSFTIKWKLISPTEFQQIANFFYDVSVTGTATVDLPKFGFPEYYFDSYSGTYLTRPTFEKYFNGYLEGVSMTVTNIRIA